MPQQTINVGTVGNDNTGDPNRTAFQKCQANFTELYTASSGYQPLDADLTALAAASGTNTLYYRSAAGVWSPVTIGSGLSFSGGVLALIGAGLTGTLGVLEAGADVASYTGTVGSVAYVGPGDVVSGALGWWGLRAYDAAAAASGMAAVRLRDAANANSADIHLLSNGRLNLADSFFSSFSGPYTIETLYDQSGYGAFINLAGSTHRPIFAATGNGLIVPHMVFIESSDLYLSNSNISCPIPMTYIGVYNNTASPNAHAIIQTIAPLNTVNAQISGANQAYSHAGSGYPIASAADGSWHLVQAIFTNSVADVLNIDNTSIVTGTNAGSSQPSASTIYIGKWEGLYSFGGFIAEAGIWPVAFNTTQQTQMYNSQHLYYGAL